MSDNTFVSLNEANRLLLEMENSDWWKEALKNASPESQDFKQGAIWGAAMAVIYINAYAAKFYPAVLPSQKEESNG